MKTVKNNNPLAKYKIFNLKAKIHIITFFFILLFTNPFSGFANTGEEIYKNVCAVCHTLTERDLTGPGLAGLSERRSEQWIMDWIRNSEQMIADGDEQAVAIFKDFNEIPMPNYPDYTDEELKSIIAYIDDNQGTSEKTKTVATNSELSETDMESGSSIFNFWLFALAILILFGLYRYKQKLKKKIEEYGFHSEPFDMPNYTLYFLLYLSLAVIAGYFLVDLLKQNYGMINTIAFIVLPYLAFLIFLVGSIYRYKNIGFKVSSLSTQFLEGKQLFKGSLLFHWGLFFLFFGHLIAFLFPSSVIAWNGQPLRLLILEFTAFAFGLSSLIGLIILIKRRLSKKMLLIVANKMDMFVYTILSVQILSGLGIAYFVRWGSSWFASVLTPYLRSVFSFNPDITALVEAHWLVQIHIISAFLLIGIIPFTRFMHFLVAPFDYAWRRYQIVLWNWNPKNIRTSIRHNFGKKPRNH